MNGKAERWGIFREDGLPFTVAAIYDSTVIDGQQVRSMSMLTINADNHPFMSQFYKSEDEKRSIIVIPEEYREDWLNAIYKEGIKYKKCGVVLTGLKPKSGHTYDLLTDFAHIDKKEYLMQAIDGIHSKFGKKKVSVRPCFIPNRNWSMSRNKLSRNPFKWDELLTIIN